MNEIRLGTIGSGPIVHSMLDAVSAVDNVRCCAVYSRTYETGRALAEKYHAEAVYTDLEAMFRDENLNFIYVASPNSLHYDQVKLALEHGKNVICEKPFCPRKEQAEELVALAKEKGLFLVEAMPTDFLPNLEVIRAQLPKIGKLKLVLCNYTQYSSRFNLVLAGEKPNIFNPQYAAGCLMDINVYNLFLNVALFGKPNSARYHANMYPGLADTSGILTLEYDGFVSQCVGAKDCHGPSFVQIQGEKGYIYVPGSCNGMAQVQVVTPVGTETIDLQHGGDRLYFEVCGITDMVLRGDYEDCHRRLATTVDVIDTLEQARKTAGIRFPGDE